MPSLFQEDGHAIYGVSKLAKLYEEFTRETIFNSSRQYCLKPSMGGSFFGGIRKETKLDRKSFRVITSLVCTSEAEIKGTLPIGKLYYFSAMNQEYYKTRAARYFNLIKGHIFTMDKACKKNVLWCFFPMYWTDRKHLIVNNLGAYALWFELPPKQKAKLYDVKQYQ